MFSANPFAVLSTYASPALVQGYVLLLLSAVVAGTGFDLLRDGKARFFLQEWRQGRALVRRQLDAGALVGIAARTVARDIATFGVFCNRRRRISHALMFYGVVLHLAASLVLVFAYPAEPAPPAVWPALWQLGALMALVGGGWFFLFLRVNVVHDGQPPWRLVQADLFIVTLLGSLGFALLFAWAAALDSGAATVLAGLYALFTTLLCLSVPWSKFPHMFYKPVAAFQKRLEEADGSSGLPAPKGDGRCPRSPI